MVRTSAQVIQDSRDYTLFPWSVQSAANPIHLTKAQGVWFWDGDGNKWLDLCSQLVNLNIGHQHPKIIEAIKRQADELCVAGPGFATEPRAELGKKLAEVTGLAKSFYCLSGTEANESAMKIARLYTGRHKIITRYRSYHGDTMGSMSVSGDFRRWPVEPGVPGIVRVFDPYCYRCPFGKTVDSCNRECVSHIEEVIQMEGPHTIAAMLAEGITGTNGLLVPPDDYYPKLRALLDKYGILLIDDEVMAGFGRTGKWLATQHYGIKPDIVTCAKGLTSSYVPLGAVIVSRGDSRPPGEQHALDRAHLFGSSSRMRGGGSHSGRLRRGEGLRERGAAGSLSGGASGGHARQPMPAWATRATRDSSACSSWSGTRPPKSRWCRTAAVRRRWASWPRISRADTPHVRAFQHVLHRAAADHQRGGAEIRSGYRGRSTGGNRPDARSVGSSYRPQ